MKATIIFEKTWDAINAVKEDGTRKYKYIIHTGSSRSSKTYSILQTHWLIALTKPNTRVSIWRETKADCKMTVLADLKKAAVNFPDYQKVNFNKTESIYLFPNGSTIEFMGGDEENRVHGFQGDVAHLNEPYLFSKEAFDQIDMRTSSFIIVDWNPKGKHWIDELSKRENAILIHSTYKDNPFVPLEQRRKIESYDPGNPHNIEQGTADAYMHSVYALGKKAEKPNRIFRNWKLTDIKEFYSLPYPSFYGLDFGISAPTALVEMKTNGDGIYFIHELLYKPLNEMKGTLSEELASLNIEKHIEIICDSGNELNQSEARKLRNAGYNAIDAKKGQGSVVSAIETVQKSIIYYTKESKNLEQNYENYSWKVYKGVQMDIPEETREDLIDAMKYVIKWYSTTRYLT